ncbi:RNA polymerase Rpc34 [Yamadazyma tenuis ATCC 10573]|uniref:DNA-directed RNA polymerase III subunit RPC6 n=1 Tax=Candida tenuis (strain ATCC 10573 / BCRC 21748 / CBS 615 / JCM 9827 / NBRC 10315 / NRRL Y-1498 / VKM Y-70) TaxID=590646 RepID=G3B1N2_CANTC|nr:RNA polymerase Rpc34 [Yamadazyma tenuis ATCC 10573]EGV64489.1 RNA polymerase Rpc34 [Yamadazyma tenuis ATCC 10573]
MTSTAPGVSQRATKLHTHMCNSSSDTLFGQDEVMKILDTSDVSVLLEVGQELVSNSLIKLIRQGEDLMFQAISVSEANKITSMSEDEAMIYSYIEASGREGIWTKTIKAKTNLHQHIVVRCLKTLENQRYIKSIKSVKHPTRKIYMLYNLQPSIDVTGGPWFTDSELDSEFIDNLLMVIWRFVASRTYPTVFQPPAANVNILQASYPYNYTGYVDLNSIMDFIIKSEITNIDLAIHDIRALCDVLVFDDRLEMVYNTVDQYKVTWQSILDAGYGIQYKEHMTPAIESVVNKQAFSIFNNRGGDVIDEEEEDLVYFDAWVHS